MEVFSESAAKPSPNSLHLNFKAFPLHANEIFLFIYIDAAQATIRQVSPRGVPHTSHSPVKEKQLSKTATTHRDDFPMSDYGAVACLQAEMKFITQ